MIAGSAGHVLFTSLLSPIEKQQKNNQTEKKNWKQPNPINISNIRYLSWSSVMSVVDIYKVTAARLF